MRIDEVCPQARTIAISGHIRPDGDCIGACMGMYLYMKKKRPGARVDIFLQKIPSCFHYIEGISEIKTYFKTGIKSYDLFIALDCGRERLGDAGPFFDAAKHTVNIDHHVSNKGTGDENYIVPTASSASELAYDVMDHEAIDVKIAEALYTGIVADTGVFRYANTSPKTMRIAAELMEYGFDFSALVDRCFYEKTYLQNQILGRALLESITLMDGRCIVSVLDRKALDFYHALPSDLEGIVSQLLMTTGAEVSIFMYELESMEYKVSLRSRGLVDVAKIAELFSGGGHTRAAGCNMHGDRYDAINNLTKFVEKQLNQPDAESADTQTDDQEQHDGEV